MIFIQAFEKAQVRPIEQQKARKKITLTIGKPDSDLVDISHTAESAMTIKFRKKAANEFDANLNIESILLQQSLSYLSHLTIPIHSLTSLNLETNEWNITLQRPPKTSPNQSKQYTSAYQGTIRHSPTDIINYSFFVPIISRESQLFYFLIEIRTARFTQQNNQWQQPTIEPIRLTPIKSSYSNELLQAAGSKLTFFFDQDGDENQAIPVIRSINSLKTLRLKQEEPFFHGMRVWRCSGENLDIALLGDSRLGAIQKPL